MPLREGPHLVKVSEHLTTTYIVCAKIKHNIATHLVHKVPWLKSHVVTMHFVRKPENNETELAQQCTTQFNLANNLLLCTHTCYIVFYPYSLVQQASCNLTMCVQLCTCISCYSIATNIILNTQHKWLKNSGLKLTHDQMELGVSLEGIV